MRRQNVWIFPLTRIRYVKEFVHGDFGRTKPNLGILLEMQTDILELDVQVLKFTIFYWRLNSSLKISSALGGGLVGEGSLVWSGSNQSNPVWGTPYTTLMYCQLHLFIISVSWCGLAAIPWSGMITAFITLPWIAKQFFNQICYIYKKNCH